MSEDEQKIPGAIHRVAPHDCKYTIVCGARTVYIRQTRIATNNSKEA